MAAADTIEVVVKTTAQDAANGVDKLAQSMEKLKGATSSASGGMQKAVDSTQKLSKSASTAAKEVKKTGDETKKAGKSAGSAAKGGFANFLSSLKRIAYYRFIRSIIKGITDGLKEGIQNLYQWSKAQKDAGAAQFAQSMDKVATAAQYLKNSIAAAASPIMNALAPAIDFIVQKLVSLINLFNQLFSFLSGKKTWTRAIEAPKEYAKAASGAAKAQQKWLAGFDELNNITTSEGGGGGGGTNYSNMFEEVPIDSDLLNLFDNLGLADKIKELQDAFQKLKDSGLLELLGNIIFDTSLYAFVNALDLLIDSLNLLADLKNGDWWAVLNDLKNIVIDLTFGPIAPVLALIDALAGTHLAPDFQNFIESLRNFDLGAWGQQAVKDVKKFFKDLPKWFTDNVTTPLVEAFGLSWEDVKQLYDNPAAFFEEHVVKPLKEKFEQIRLNIKQKFDSAWLSVKNVWLTVKTWFENNVIKPIKDKFETVRLWIKQKFDSALKTVKEIWANPGLWFQNHVIKPIKDKFEEVKKNAKEKFEGAWQKVKDTFSPERVKLYFENRRNDIVNKFISLKSKLGEKFTEAWQKVKDTFSPDRVKLYFENRRSDIVNKFTSIGSKLKEKFQEAWKNIKEVFTYNKLTTFFGGVRDNILNVFKSIGTKVGDAISKTFKDAINGALAAAEGVVSKGVGLINSVIRAYNSTWIASRLGSVGYVSFVGFPRVYAQGGFPDMGEIFVARESGPEMVGQIGSRNAVANNDQIVEGVANGVYRAIVDTGLVGMVGSIDRKSGSGGSPVFAPSVAAGRWVSRSLAMYQAAGG